MFKSKSLRSSPDGSFLSFDFSGTSPQQPRSPILQMNLPCRFTSSLHLFRFIFPCPLPMLYPIINFLLPPSIFLSLKIILLCMFYLQSALLLFLRAQKPPSNNCPILCLSKRYPFPISFFRSSFPVHASLTSSCLASSSSCSHCTCDSSTLLSSRLCLD